MNRTRTIPPFARELARTPPGALYALLIEGADNVGIDHNRLQGAPSGGVCITEAIKPQAFLVPLIAL
jgi:hypothetical protein